jgi:hypothetical protein
MDVYSPAYGIFIGNLSHPHAVVTKIGEF